MNKTKIKETEKVKELKPLTDEEVLQQYTAANFGLEGYNQKEEGDKNTNEI